MAARRCSACAAIASWRTGARTASPCAAPYARRAPRCAKTSSAASASSSLRRRARSEGSLARRARTPRAAVSTSTSRSVRTSARIAISRSGRCGVRTPHAYLAALHAEIDAAPAFAARTLFFGGGTPNTYEPAAIARLVSARARASRRTGFAEALDRDESRRRPLHARDVRDVPRRRHRSHLVRRAIVRRERTRARSAAATTRDDVAAAVRRARDAGFANVSLDLIFGTPGQTPDSWRASLDAALALEPAHVSTYGLTVEEDTPFAGWYERVARATFPSNDLEAELYGIAIDVLADGRLRTLRDQQFRAARHALRAQRELLAERRVSGARRRRGVLSRRARAPCTRATWRRISSAAEAGRPIPGDAERLDGARASGRSRDARCCARPRGWTRRHLPNDTALISTTSIGRYWATCARRERST